MTRKRREVGLTGRRLGEFIIEDMIGAGGFGVVYRASQPLLERQAVVKVLHTQLSATTEVTDRFLREARLASRLDHPYAAHTYAFGAESDGTLWIAMELVRGSTLASYMRTHGPMPLEKFVPLLERICEVVHTAHTQNIVHRDLKPANVMVVSRAGRLLPKLLDFGIAKSMLADPLPPALIVDDDGEPVSSVDNTSGESVAPTLPPADSVEVDHTMAASTGESPAPARASLDTGPTALPRSTRPVVPATEPTALPRSTQPIAPATEPTALPRSTQPIAPATGPTQAVSRAGDSSRSSSSQLTGHGAMMGSPHYMAPEQWVDVASVGPPADLYALGVLAYEALTGSPPFSGDLSKLHASHKSAPIPSVPETLPSALDAVFVRALAKSPADRYSDALELAAAFREAAGLSSQRRPLPQLEESIRDRFLSDAPQPLAEAIAGLDGARDPRQARDALWVVVDTLARYVALAAVAARARWSSGDPPPGVTTALRELGTTMPEAEDWLAIARSLVESAADQPDLHPLPELVMFLSKPDGGRGDGVARFDQLADQRELLADPNAADEVVRGHLADALVSLSALLRDAEFVCDYPVVVPVDEGTADQWIGLRRPRRTALTLPADVAVEVGQPILVDWDGNPVVSLHPLIQIAAPAPGATPEMFLYAGRDKRGARLTAPPLAFVRHESEIVDWLRMQLATTLDTMSPSPREDDKTPYLGLRPFSTADADRFLGRERHVEGVVNRLRVQPLLAVVGESGAGKSSFVQAGVIPRLEGWDSITLRPGAAPMSALAAHVDDPERLVAEPTSLGDALRQRAARKPLVLVIDQLEELFTLCDDGDERAAFASAIASVARAAEDPVRVVLTIRDDFLVQLERLPGLRERLARGLVLLTTPARDDLERIVREPARRAGYSFEDPELPARMVDEVAGQPGALALISFTAATLWERRDRHFKRIPSQAYETIGGVGGALAQHAESLLESLPAEQRGLVRNVFSHLVTAEGTRAVLSHAELRELSGAGATAESVVETLIEGRLLVASESEDGDDRIEIIHEALLSAWPRLVEWRRDAAEGARLRDQLRGAAKQWDARGRPRALLWRDELLVDLERWRAKEPELTSLEEAFADASAADAARGRRLRRRVVIAALTLLSAGVVLLLVLNSRVEEQRVAAENQRAVAEDQRARAQENLVELYEENGRQALLARDYFRAAAYLSAAYSSGADTPALRFMLAQALRPMRSRPIAVDHGEPITWVSFSPDGRKVVTTGIAARQPKVWSAAGGELLYELPAQASIVRMATFDAAGARLATAGFDNVARVYAADTGAPIAELDHGAQVRWVAFDPTGAQLATAGADGAAKIWNIEGATLARTLAGKGVIDTLAWSPNGARLVTAATSGVAAVWDTRTGVLLRDLEGHAGRIFRVLYPSDDVIITAAFDGTARRWSPDTGASEVVARHPALIMDAAVDPALELLATTSGDGTVKLTEVSGRPVASIAGHRGAVFSVSFSPDGQRLLTASFDGTARVWDRTGMLVGVLAGQSAPFYRGQFSPAGDRIAVASVDGKLRLWPSTTEPPVRVLPKHEAPLRSIDFSHDSRRLVATAADGTIRVTDVESRETLAEIKSAKAPQLAVALGDAVVVADDTTLTIRDDSGAVASSQPLEAPIWDGSVSPSGERLVTVSVRMQATVWNIGGRRLEKDKTRAARWAQWTDDNQLLLVTESGVVAWDPATDKETLTLDAGPARSVHACRDGGALSVDNGNGMARWSADGKRLGSRQLKSHYVVSATAGCQFAAVFGDWGSPTLVDLESGRALDFLEIASKRFWFIDMTPDGRRVGITENNRVLFWEIEQITETPAEIERLIRCTVPYRVVGANLESAPLTPCTP